MARIVFTLREVFCAAIFLLPVLLILNKVRFHNGPRTAAYFFFACYLSAVYVLVGLPNVTYVRLELNLNVVPFVGMRDDLKNSMLNILLFVPFGFGLPVLWERYREGKWTVLSGLGLSLTIELLQMLTLRATDVNDLITNTLGTALGWFAAKLLLKCVPSRRGGKRPEDAGILLAAVFGVMFFAHPFLSNLMWKFL